MMKGYQRKETMYYLTDRTATLSILQNAQRLLDNPKTSAKVRLQQTEIVRVHRQHI